MDSVQTMRECEARTWLRLGYTTKAKVAELKKKLAAHRPEHAIELLVQEMRKQWLNRHEWLNDRQAS